MNCYFTSVNYKEFWWWYIHIILTVTGILNFVLHLVFWTEPSISDTGSFSLLRWKGEEACSQMDSIRKRQSVDHWLRLFVSDRPKWIDLSVCLVRWGLKWIQFQNVFFYVYNTQSKSSIILTESYILGTLLCK